MTLPPVGSIHVLTHAKELQHPTNTAKLAFAIAKEFNIPLFQHVWRRTEREQLATLFSADFTLVYPRSDATQLDASLHSASPYLAWTTTTRFVLIDATWQQAQKMMNQSPYLQRLATLQLNPCHASSFTRRRNQRQGAWCTAEVIQFLWQSQGHQAAAAALAEHFRQFNGHAHG